MSTSVGCSHGACSCGLSCACPANGFATGGRASWSRGASGTVIGGSQVVSKRRFFPSWRQNTPPAAAASSTPRTPMTMPVPPPPLPPALLSLVIVPAGVVKPPACVGVLGGCVAPGVAVSACDGDAVRAAGDDGCPDADVATL